MEKTSACADSEIRKSSVYDECEQEIQRYKWIESEKAGRDLGEAAIRRWVKERTRFQIGSSHPGTSAIDTYECGSGVCRDFSHLMIAICRALNIPARFATGIDYGADPALGPPDFHCYVEALLGERWWIFDPSEISPRMGLIRIATGRDASDVAFATISARCSGRCRA